MTKKKKDPVPAKYKQKRKWLIETAREMRLEIKPDCQPLIDYLKEKGIHFIYRPAIMLKDIGYCKGYIPDIVIFYLGAKVVVDFVDTNSKYYSKEYYVSKAADLEKDGYLYYIIRKGGFAGDNDKNIIPFFNEVKNDILFEKREEQSQR